MYVFTPEKNQYLVSQISVVISKNKFTGALFL